MALMRMSMELLSAKPTLASGFLLTASSPSGYVSKNCVSSVIMSSGIMIAGLKSH